MTDGKVHTVKKRYDSKTMSMKPVVVETDEVAEVEAADAADVQHVTDDKTAAEKPAAEPKAKPGKNARKRVRNLVTKKKSE